MKKFLSGLFALLFMFVYIIGCFPSFHVYAANAKIFDSGAVVIDKAMVEEFGNEFIIKQGVYSVTVTDGVDVALIFDNVKIDRSADGSGEGPEGKNNTKPNTVDSATAKSLYEAGKRLNGLTGSAAWSKRPKDRSFKYTNNGTEVWEVVDPTGTGYYVPTCPFLITGEASATVRFDGDCEFRAGGNGWFLTSETDTTLQNANDIAHTGVWRADSFRNGYAGIQVDGDSSLNIINANNLKAYGSFQLAGVKASWNDKSYPDDPLDVNPIYNSKDPWDRPYAVHQGPDDNGGGAGIGGGAAYDTTAMNSKSYTAGTPGEIVIQGGNIYSVGGHMGAGIGGGSNAAVTTSQIVINGGNITAIGGRFGTGIGAGDSASKEESVSYKNKCTVIINGGTINAYGGTSAAAIGSSDNLTLDENGNTMANATASGLSIVINGGEVYAQSGMATKDGEATAAIGSGRHTDMEANSIEISSNAKIVAASFSHYAISDCGTDISAIPTVNVDPNGYVFLARFDPSETERVFNLYPIKNDVFGNPMVVSASAQEVFSGTIPADAVYYAMDHTAGENYNRYYCVDKNGTPLDASGNPTNQLYYPDKLEDNLSVCFDKSTIIESITVPGKYRAVAITLPDPSEYGGHYLLHVPSGADGESDDIFSAFHKHTPGTTSGELEKQGNHHIQAGPNPPERSQQTPNFVEDVTAEPFISINVFPYNEDGSLGGDALSDFAPTKCGYTIYLPHDTKKFQLETTYKAINDVSVSVTADLGITKAGELLYESDPENPDTMVNKLDVEFNGKKSIDIWLRKTDIKIIGKDSDGNPITESAVLVYKITVILKEKYIIIMDPLSKTYDGVKSNAVIDRIIATNHEFDFNVTENPETVPGFSCSTEGMRLDGTPETVVDKYTGSFYWDDSSAPRTLEISTTVLSTPTSVYVFSLLTTIRSVDLDTDITFVTNVNVKGNITYPESNPLRIDGFRVIAENGVMKLQSVTDSTKEYEILRIERDAPVTKNYYDSVDESDEDYNAALIAKKDEAIAKLKEDTVNKIKSSEFLTASVDFAQYDKGYRQVKYGIHISHIDEAGKTEKNLLFKDTTSNTVKGNLWLITTYHAIEEVVSLLRESQTQLEFKYYKDNDGDRQFNPAIDEEIIGEPPKDAGNYFVSASLTEDTYEAYGGRSFMISKKEIQLLGIENWLTSLSEEELAVYDGIIEDVGKLTFSGVVAGDDITFNPGIKGKYADRGEEGYFDDIGYHARKILLENVYLSEQSAKNYVITDDVVETDTEGNTVRKYYVPGRLVHTFGGTIFRKTENGLWRKFYPATEDTYLKWNEDGTPAEGETRIDYHSPSNTEHREYVYVRTLNKGKTDARYAVDIEFGAMSFTYSHAVWNVNTHQYEESDTGRWTGNSGTNNQVTIRNYSNREIQFSVDAKIDFIYSAVNADSQVGISVGLKHNGETYKTTTQIKVDPATETSKDGRAAGGPSSESISVVLDGVPQMNSESFKAVGSVTVSVSKVS